MVNDRLGRPSFEHSLGILCIFWRISSLSSFVVVTAGVMSAASHPTSFSMYCELRVQNEEYLRLGWGPSFGYSRDPSPPWVTNK